MFVCHLAMRDGSFIPQLLYDMHTGMHASTHMDYIHLYVYAFACINVLLIKYAKYIAP